MNKSPRSVQTSQARAAGMARSTAGRARTFDPRNDFDDSADQIAEALEDRENAKRPRS